MIFHFKLIIDYLLLKSKKLNYQVRKNSKLTIENGKLIKVRDAKKQ